MALLAPISATIGATGRVWGGESESNVPGPERRIGRGLGGGNNASEGDQVGGGGRSNGCLMGAGRIGSSMFTEEEWHRELTPPPFVARSRPEMALGSDLKPRSNPQGSLPEGVDVRIGVRTRPGPAQVAKDRSEIYPKGALKAGG